MEVEVLESCPDIETTHEDIETADECRKAAGKLGFQLGSVANGFGFPFVFSEKKARRGCLTFRNYAYFNNADDTIRDRFYGAICRKKETTTTTTTTTTTSTTATTTTTTTIGSGESSFTSCNRVGHSPIFYNDILSLREAPQ